MLSPMFLPDLRVGPSPHPFEERVVLRRGAPQRLRITPEIPGARRVEPVPMRAPAAPRVGRPSPWRVRLGLSLIAWGRRLAGPRAA